MTFLEILCLLEAERLRTNSFHCFKCCSIIFPYLVLCLLPTEDHISNQRDATFYAHLLIATLYMFRASLAHYQELRNWKHVVLLSINEDKSCISLVTYMFFIYKDVRPHEYKIYCQIFSVEIFYF